MLSAAIQKQGGWRWCGLQKLIDLGLLGHSPPPAAEGTLLLNTQGQDDLPLDGSLSLQAESGEPSLTFQWCIETLLSPGP